MFIIFIKFVSVNLLIDRADFIKKLKLNFIFYSEKLIYFSLKLTHCSEHLKNRKHTKWRMVIEYKL